MKLLLFLDGQILATGRAKDVTQPFREASARGKTPVALDATTGRVVDLDLRDGDDAPRDHAPPRRGRPKLGVRAREVTLLPRHWAWLAEQRGGASGALRRLVEAAMRAEADTPDPRHAQDAAYRAATVLAGDLPGYEEAIRALYAGQLDAMAEAAAAWPADVRRFVLGLARGETA